MPQIVRIAFGDNTFVEYETTDHAWDVVSEHFTLNLVNGAEVTVRAVMIKFVVVMPEGWSALDEPASQ